MFDNKFSVNLERDKAVLEMIATFPV